MPSHGNKSQPGDSKTGQKKTNPHVKLEGRATRPPKPDALHKPNGKNHLPALSRPHIPLLTAGLFSPLFPCCRRKDT